MRLLLYLEMVNYTSSLCHVNLTSMCGAMDAFRPG